MNKWEKNASRTENLVNESLERERESKAGKGGRGVDDEDSDVLGFDAGVGEEVIKGAEHDLLGLFPGVVRWEEVAGKGGVVDELLEVDGEPRNGTLRVSMGNRLCEPLGKLGFLGQCGIWALRVIMEAGLCKPVWEMGFESYCGNWDFSANVESGPCGSACKLGFANQYGKWALRAIAEIGISQPKFGIWALRASMEAGLCKPVWEMGFLGQCGIWDFWPSWNLGLAAWKLGFASQYGKRDLSAKMETRAWEPVQKLGLENRDCDNSFGTETGTVVTVETT
ncbi:hypothetical protein LR48_Vigan02g224600 [Vigna angularis]|uniref:Uncharacterized protein n=1 Tax=Phaseolus angularis TaxID=3914 RepID=A0A0L9U016_PHAAN|nr:hypothetical protein LR48_Vigan02g224600 [Vigna angularis]